MNKKEIEHQDTELRLGLPGSQIKTQINKRSFSNIKESSSDAHNTENETAPQPK